MPRRGFPETEEPDVVSGFRALPLAVVTSCNEPVKFTCSLLLRCASVPCNLDRFALFRAASNHHTDTQWNPSVTGGVAFQFVRVVVQLTMALNTGFLLAHPWRVSLAGQRWQLGLNLGLVSFAAFFTLCGVANDVCVRLPTRVPCHSSFARCSLDLRLTVS